MSIVLNGKNVELAKEVNRFQICFVPINLENRIVVVEVNQEITYKEQYDSTILS